MSDENETKGNGTAKVIGAGVGGGLAYHFGAKKITGNGIKEAMSYDPKIAEKAPKKFQENLAKVYDAKPALKQESGAIALTKEATKTATDKSVKTSVAEAEKKLIGNIRTEGKTLKSGFGVGNLGNSGKLKVAGIVLAGIAAGTFVANKLSGGGKHEQRLQAERAASQDLGRA